MSSETPMTQQRHICLIPELREVRPASEVLQRPQLPLKRNAMLAASHAENAIYAAGDMRHLWCQGANLRPRITDSNDREAAADIWRDYVARVGEIIVKEKQMRARRSDYGLPTRLAEHRTQSTTLSAESGRKSTPNEFH